MLKTATLRSKDAVNYRKASGVRTCGNCKYFSGDSSTCQLVAGSISAGDLCDIWEGSFSYKEATHGGHYHGHLNASSDLKISEVEVKEAQISRDLQIVTFALNLEYLEVEYYSGLTKVDFSDDAFKEFAEEILANEKAHVALFKETLGDDAIDKPELDIAGFFTEFDPYENETNFFLGGVLIEDVGVTAYNGAAPTIEDADLRQTVSGILAVEAYHMGMARSLLYLVGDDVRGRHAKAVEGDDKSQPLVVDGKANFVPAEKGIAFARSPREVLDIVTLKAGATEGGFFPKGLNGDIKGLL